MNLQNINKKRAEKGFTIVELLIVIVVIGILAAIVIVAYNGVTNRAKTSKAQGAAQNFMKKAEAYNAEIGSYPDTFSDLTGAAASTSYYLTGVTLDADAITAAPANEATVSVFTCSAGAPTTTNIYAVQYWDYAANAAVKLYFGGATSSSTCTTAVAS